MELDEEKSYKVFKCKTSMETFKHAKELLSICLMGSSCITFATTFAAFCEDEYITRAIACAVATAALGAGHVLCDKGYKVQKAKLSKYIEEAQDNTTKLGK